MTALVCRAALAVVFLAAAASKVRGGASYREFRDSLVRMRLVPRGTAGAAAVGMVVAEAVVAVAVCVPATAGAGLAAAAVELAVLTGGIAVTVRRGLAVPCRCFGPSRRPLGRLHLVRNTALIAVAVLGWVALDPAADPDGPALALGVAAGVLLGLLAVSAEGLVELFGPLPVAGQRR